MSKVIGAVPLIALIAGTYWWNSNQQAESLAGCMRMVAKYEEIYTRQRPDRHVDTPALQSSWSRARGLCKDERPHVAWDVVYRAISTCRFNNGCSDVPVDISFKR